MLFSINKKKNKTTTLEWVLTKSLISAGVMIAGVLLATYSVTYGVIAGANIKPRPVRTKAFE